MPYVMVPMREEHVDYVMQIVPVSGPRGGGSGAGCRARRPAAGNEAPGPLRKGAE
jgi:hypothetical protein